MLKLENLAEFLEKNRAAASARVREFSIGGKKFNFNSQPAIMGVVNLSADSWYRESVCLSAEAAVQRGKILAAQGADIIDIGAESTLGHAARADDECAKIQIDSRHQKIARGKNSRFRRNLFAKSRARGARSRREYFESDRNGANSKEIFKMVAAHDAAVIICFVQGKNVREVGDFDLSADPIEMMRDYFSRQIEIAQRSGVKKSSSIPALDFITATCRTAPFACVIR